VDGGFATYVVVDAAQAHDVRNRPCLTSNWPAYRLLTAQRWGCWSVLPLVQARPFW
jgi:hypothetical protein